MHVALTPYGTCAGAWTMSESDHAEKERTIMRRKLGGWRWLAVVVPVLLVALILVGRGLTAVPAARAATVFNVDVPTSGIVTDICPGGESVAFSGTAHLLLTFTADAAGGIHGDFLANGQGVTGTGLTSGAVYQFPVANRANFDLTAANGYTQTSTLAGALVGQGPAAKSELDILFHITVTPSGTVAVLIDSLTLKCH